MALTPGLFVGSVVVACGLLLALAKWADRSPQAETIHTVQTEDGWQLALHHFKSVGPSRCVTPVILGHGLMMNRSCWALDPENSMIAALQAAGFEVFAAEYRGNRSSRGPAHRRSPEYWDFDLLDHAQQDLPAIIDAVRSITAADRVHWVGHSMGGVVAYLYGAIHGCKYLDRVVTLGSPVRTGKIRGPGLALLRILRKLQPGRKVFRARLALLPVLPLALMFPQLLKIAINPRNLSTRARLTLIRGAAEDLSTRLLDNFLAQGPANLKTYLESKDGGDRMKSFNAPLLVVAGGSDLLAPPAVVAPAMERVGSAQRRYLLLDGTDLKSGAPSLGHSDLISSPAAARHLFPTIIDWLQADQDTGDGSLD